MLSKVACLVILTVLVAPVVAAEDEPAPDLVEELLLAEGSEAKTALIEKILAAGQSPDELAERIAAGLTYASDAPTGWLARMNPCADGVERPYLLFVPADYDPSKRYRLVVDMHGGVGRPALLTHAELEQMKFFWGEHAEANGYLLALPTGQAGAEWWTETGAENVLSIVAATKREYNVDESRIFATGFSDGGSGSFYLALTHTTPFAGFVPLNGHVAVAGVRGHQIHLRNLLNKPMYVVNTENDSLYPSAGVKPIIEALEELGAPVVWRDIPTFTHNPMYLPGERPAIWKWMQAAVRDPHPDRVVWEGVPGSPGRVHWLSVTAIGDSGNDAEFPDVNPKLPPGRVRLGVALDQGFPGPGLRVRTVTENSPAAAAGMLEGDVIIGLDEDEIADMRALRAALGAKTFGDDFTVIVRRADEERALTGAFPAMEPQPAFTRRAAWGSIEAEIRENTVEVRCRRIGAFDLYLGADRFDLDKPVVVIVNGETVHDAVVAPDLAFMLKMAGEDEDRTMVYSAGLSIEVPKNSEPAPDKAVGPPQANRMRPDHAPTPFSAEEIREASHAGRVSTFKIENSTKKVSLQTFKFLGGDEENAEFEISMAKADGTPIGEARKARAPWTTLQSHASYPADTTEITSEEIETPAGTFDCWLYTVKKPDEVITRCWFAKTRPGPPVRVVEERGGKPVMSMTLVK